MTWPPEKDWGEKPAFSHFIPPGLGLNITEMLRDTDILQIRKAFNPTKIPLTHLNPKQIL